jgi:hypothetical protein
VSAELFDCDPSVVHPIMGEAIPFIQWKNEQFVVEKAAAAALATIRGKIAVVVVAGPYR